LTEQSTIGIVQVTVDLMSMILILSESF